MIIHDTCIGRLHHVISNISRCTLFDASFNFQGNESISIYRDNRDAGTVYEVGELNRSIKGSHTCIWIS